MSHPTALYVDAGIQASKYSNVGTFAVLIFDYFITLEAESLWVWHRKWTFVRFIFTVSRYLPFFGIGMTFIAALRTQYYPGESCVRFGQASNMLHIICIVAAEGLLITRIYASWKSKRLLTFLLVFPVVCLVISYILSHPPLVVFDYENASPINIPDPARCLLSGGRGGVFEYAALLLYELVLLCLMFVHQIQQVQRYHRTLPRNVFQRLAEIYDMYHGHVFVQHNFDHGSPAHVGFNHRLSASCRPQCSSLSDPI
ncbi:hypothetical protein DFJ58DRAFT_171042 [Suillus subalutaceus]|uniref:uncharacterized protein n=1 Tax=Suillus subalutaceus TaxID=48586 RepID=UPI001B883513|nr:uncharacterized protein DFJ58DRAFT_171042 [Suillus subalutaceus]KAG1836545.1 hypothetical protein DFJ58DRAFT_171042 [Suillus subalutaceus]